MDLVEGPDSYWREHGSCRHDCVDGWYPVRSGRTATPLEGSQGSKVRAAPINDPRVIASTPLPCLVPQLVPA